MARQRGTFPITGKLDEVVFYKTTDEGFLVRTKGYLSKERLKTAPEFEGSRRANTAFSRAARGTKLLRLAMGGEALLTAESRMAGRMNAKMMRILNADKHAATLDEKLVGRGNLQLLVGHAWNRLKPVKSAIGALYKVSMDRGLGELEVHFEKLYGKRDVTGPGAATHYEIFAVGALLDFEEGYFQNDKCSSGVLPINNTVRTISMRCNVAADSTLPMILGMGIVFYQEQNGVAYRLNEGACFEIVGTETLDH